MGKWCLHFGFAFSPPVLTEEAQTVMAEIENSFRRAIDLPLTEEAVVMGRTKLMETVGRVVATGELPDDREKLFLIDVGERIGKLATHMALDQQASAISAIHVEDASRVVRDDREHVMEKIRARAARRVA